MISEESEEVDDTNEGIEREREGQLLFSYLGYVLRKESNSM